MKRKPQCWYKNLKLGDKVLVKYDKDYHMAVVAGHTIEATLCRIHPLQDNSGGIRVSFIEAHLPSIYLSMDADLFEGWSGRIIRKVK